MAPWTPSKTERLPHPKGEAAVRGTTLVTGSVAPGNSSSRSRANPADLRRRSLFDLNPLHRGDLRTTCCRGTLHPVGRLRSGSCRPTPPRPYLCPHYASRAARCQGESWPRRGLTRWQGGHRVRAQAGQVLTHARLGARSIPSPDRGGELGQFPEGLRGPAFHPDGVQFDRGELAADRLDRPLQAAVQPHPGDRAVQVGGDGGQALVVGLLQRGAVVLDQPVQFGQECAGGPLRRAPRREPLERLQHLVEFVDVGAAEPRHSHALSGHGLDEPLRLQPAQGVADGGAADVPDTGEFKFVDPRPWRNLPAQDGVSDQAIGGRADRLARRRRAPPRGPPRRAPRVGPSPDRSELIAYCIHKPYSGFCVPSTGLRFADANPGNRPLEIAGRLSTMLRWPWTCDQRLPGGVNDGHYWWVV